MPLLTQPSPPLDDAPPGHLRRVSTYRTLKSPLPRTPVGPPATAELRRLRVTRGAETAITRDQTDGGSNERSGQGCRAKATGTVDGGRGTARSRLRQRDACCRRSRGVAVVRSRHVSCWCSTRSRLDHEIRHGCTAAIKTVARREDA